MKISELFKQKKPVLGFEIFPPKLDLPLESIYDSLEKFVAMSPDYISVTYGAGGSKKGRTVEIASKIKNDYNVESMAHFTCVGHTLEDIDRMLASMKDNNLKNVLALRGDDPENNENYDPNRNAYCFAKDLVSHIKSKNDFCVAAAAHLEGHPECKRLSEDMLNLKKKVDGGVDFLVTQFFFDNRIYYNFVDRAQAVGINCPIVPGIMPIFKSDQIKAMTAKSGCSIPAKLVLMMDSYNDNPEDLRKAGIEYAAEQIRDLVDSGAPGLHLYTMNRPKSTREILSGSGLL